MITASPPPIIPAGKKGMSPYLKLPIAAALLIGISLTTFIILFMLGLIRPFRIPTAAMAPTMLPGDKVVMEEITLHRCNPQRGDIIVFRTEGIPSLPQDQFYIKRVAGCPGEHVLISDGKLYVNDTQLTIAPTRTAPTYQLPGPTPFTDLTVSKGQYYVLGDNATNSFDSRSYGCVPAENIIGLVRICYWPPKGIGLVR
jgi:signal peptidase I